MMPGWVREIVEGKTKKLFGYIIWKCLMDYMYAAIVTDVYSYMGHVADYNYTKLAISWILMFGFLFLSEQIKEGLLKVSYEFLIVLSFIPTLTVWWTKNENSTAMTLIALYWCVWGMVSAIVSKSKMNNSFYSYLSQNRDCHPALYKEKDSNERTTTVMMVFFISMLIMLYFSYKYGNMRIIVRLGDVYNYRHAKGNRMSGIESYVFGWLSTIVLPFVLLFFLEKKRRIFALITCVLISMSYSIYGQKSTFLMMLLVLGISLLKNINFQKAFLNYIILGLNIVAILACALEKLKITRWGLALVERLTLEVAAGPFYYYDFFQTHELLFLRQSILRLFMSNPYDNAIGIIIGSSAKYNLTGDVNNFNNGVFSDAFANFGIIGVFLYPILFVISLQLYDNLLGKVKASYKYMILCWLLLYCMSIGYFQWLISGGFVVALIMLKLYRKYRLRVIYKV